MHNGTNIYDLARKITTEKITPMINELNKWSCGFDSEACIGNFSMYIVTVAVEEYLDTNDFDSSGEKYIYGFKNWCFPCDSGISYYDGEKSCYIHLDENFDVKYINKYSNGCYITSYRNQIHYALTPNHYNYIQNFELWDIYKSWEQNRMERPITPIYDLNLYKSNITDVLGISADVKDILEKQTQIYTKFLTFND